MSTEQEQIHAAIAALSAQRAVLGDTVVDLAVAPLLARLAAVDAPAADPAEQTLRQVTILFLDVVGSTALSQHLDPEDIHVLMDGVLDRCTAIVGSHHGKVLQYAGDSLLAVFGADRAREDDAECAVRAGLVLIDEGRRQGESVRRTYGHDGFTVRIGVHTGPVLLGGGLDAEGRIRGIAVNIAARMEQTAPAGTMRISRDTYRQVRGLFDVDEQSPLQVKGIDHPITSYLVQRARPRAFRALARGLEGGLSNDVLVGRDDQLRALSQAFDAARAERSLRMVTVVADAGMGKSRLLLEVEARLMRDPPSARLLHGRAQRHGINTPYGVIRDVLAWHCDIADSDGPDIAGAKLMATFGARFGARADEQCAIVGQLIGLDFSDSVHIAGIVQDGRQIRARAFHALAQYLRMHCPAQGDLVVMLLDDLHWADDGSLDLIEHLATECGDLPVVIGCFARPALIERRPTWGEGSAHASRLVLQPLAPAGSERLLDALLARLSDPPPELRALILDNAEGNPFHMEELLGMLIDDRVVVSTPDGWHVDRGRLGQTRVPSTLTAVLQARLDALSPLERLALQRDSVIGHVFWDEALRQIAPDSIDVLDQLAERELISRREGSAFAGVREFVFKHHLLHQVTYDTVLKGPRRELHRRTADWLVAITGERIGEHLGLIAEHYERAGAIDEGVAYLQRAGEAAYGAAAFGPALDYLDRALALAPDDALRTRFDLLAVRGNVCNATGRRKEQAEGVQLQADYAERLDDDGRRAKVARYRSLLAVLTGEYTTAIAEADRACRLAGTTDDPDTTLNALLDKAQALIYLGDAVAAEACLEAMLPLARASSDARLEVTALNRLSTIAKHRGDYVAARRLLESALAVARASGNRRFEGGLMGNIGNLELDIGNHAKARALTMAGLDVVRAIGDRGSECYVLEVVATLDLEEGDVPSALSTALAGRDIARDAGDTACAATCALLAGICHVEAHDPAAAAACFDDYERWADHAAVPRGAQSTLAERAMLALAEGRVDDALAIVAEIVAWLDGRSDEIDREDLRRRYVCYRVLTATGSPRADAFLARAHAQLVRQAATMTDADRAAHLGNVRLHRAIVDAWSGRGATEPSLGATIPEAADGGPIEVVVEAP